jgi:hypothetical protein
MIYIVCYHPNDGGVVKHFNDIVEAYDAAIVWLCSAPEGCKVELFDRDDSSSPYAVYTAEDCWQAESC